MFDIANPRQVILVSSRAEVELMGKKEVKDNIMTLSWHTPLSQDPELYGILVSKNRFSYQVIKKSQVFVVNFMSTRHQEDVLYCGRNTGQVVDKFKETSFAKKEAKSIDCPVIEEAIANLECEVQEEIELGDHVMFVGRVVKKNEKDCEKRVFYLGFNKFTTTIS